MGCVCCSLSSFISILLDALERISLCTVCALLTCCLLFTILAIMIIGMGIGFHYCFVQNSVDSMAKAAKSAGALRSGGPQTPGHVMRSVEKAVRRGFAHRFRQRRDADGDTPYNNTNFSQEMYLNDTLHATETDLNFTQPYNITGFHPLNRNLTDQPFNITEFHSLYRNLTDQPLNITDFHSLYRNLTRNLASATNFTII